jgi:hypothetical protein
MNGNFRHYHIVYVIPLHLRCNTITITVLYLLQIECNSHTLPMLLEPIQFVIVTPLQCYLRYKYNV